MSKKWKSDRDTVVLEEVPKPPPEPERSPEQEALAELYRTAKAMNGIDHMKLCAFYVVASDHCDCGLNELRTALRALEATTWTP
jgi:hypothetical protein